MKESITHGGRSKKFEWEYDCNRERLFIKNEDGRVHIYDLLEIMDIIDWIDEKFGPDWFPLANNVKKLGDGTEKSGLGLAILLKRPKDVTHAQGSSYLGVVFEEANIFLWNGKKKGIHWRFVKHNYEISEIRRLLGECT